MSEEDILNEIRNSGINLVEITGGEPLLQKEVLTLIEKLLDEGYKVLIETNGSQSIKGIDKRAVVILDIKTPGSGMSEAMDFSNIDEIKNTDEIKFVITDRADYEWAKGIIDHYGLVSKCHLLMSPAYGLLHPEKLAKWMLEDRLEARLNLQLHKYIFGSERRGV
jgi:7-carboxy-7-deazaguanine synthase